MKKLIVLSFLIVITITGFSQGLLKPVTFFPTKAENDKKVKLGEAPITHKWVWRFDASIAIIELNYDKTTKQFATSSFSAVAPAIGYQHYIPTSETDLTPFNNYGISAAFLLGENIYNPNLAAFKFALVANIMQYFKFGLTVTPKPTNNLSPVGLFFGGGITF